MALRRPRLWWQFCFNADPNDTAAIRLWTDYTHMVRKAGENRRGRNYELALSTAASPPITWRDPDEILNPVNTSSPQNPNIQPYRAILGQAMWPNPDVSLGSAVNLINSARWRPNNEVVCDPSFESYANGDPLPGWLTAVGPTVPTISTTDPQQGTKSLAIPITAGGSALDRQGVSWRADCVPGQQYTTSAYVRQTSASTLRLSATDQTLGWDEFRTASASTWGTAPLGGAWTNTGGVNGDFTVAGEQGLISVTATASDRFVTMDVGNIDTDQTCMFAGVTTPVGAGSQQGMVSRYVDVNNHYLALIAVDTSGFVVASIRERSGGVLVTMASVTSTVRADAGGVMARFQSFGMELKFKIWNEYQPEPTAWTATASDSTLVTGTRVGTFARRDASETSPTVFAFKRYYVTGYVSSTTTTTTGSYVRLSVTFTATQPIHPIQITTIGVAVAGTVRLDAIQHEPGASASAFSTTGPVIFPILDNYAERFPREWQAAGFVGTTTTPAVDGFAALNAISIPTEYVAAVADTFPSYYWPLSGGSGTAQALEVSGNGGPFLSRYDAVEGPGNAPEFGTPTGVVGNPGSTGVRFEPTSTSGGVPDSMLSAGRLGGSSGIKFPRAITNIWSASIAFWVTVSDTVDPMITYAVLPIAPDGVTWPLAVTLDYFSPGPVNIQLICRGVSGDAEAEATMEVGVPTLIVGTVSQVGSGGNTFVDLYVNGSLAGIDVVTTASMGGLIPSPATIMDVGGRQGSFVLNGTMSDVALWERALTAAEITTLWNAGGLGYAGETTGTRFARHLVNGRYAGATRISAGSTTLQPPSWTGTLDLLSDGQSLAVTEAGNIWVAPDGACVLEGKQDRWLRLTSTATFGEDVASGEIPYMDGIMFDNDPTFVYANVQITRNGGAQARGGTQADIATATRKFFGRSYAIGGDFQTDVLAQYYADYTFNTHKAPVTRVSVITIDPSSYPDIWNTALRLEIGQRVTVKRRAKAANSGAGITMSAEYFIETVIHHEIDMDKQMWKISFLLSPIGVVPGPSFQPWILENATYGVLDSTTILGW